jgi:hypothetical protein
MEWNEIASGSVANGNDAGSVANGNDAGSVANEMRER